MAGRSQYLNPESKTPLFFQVLDIRKSQQRDTIILVTGEKRIGKSYCCLKIAERIDPNFDPEKQVFFEPKYFVRWLKGATDSVCVIEETSVSMSNRSWFEITNKIMRQIITIQGYKRNVFLLNLPVLSHLDAQIVSLCSILLNGVRQGLFIPYRLKNYQFKKQFVPIRFPEILKFDLPSKHIVEKYEAMKDEWNSRMLQEDDDFFKALEDQESFAKKFKPRDYLDALSKGIMTEENVKKKLITMGHSSNDSDMMIELQKANDVLKSKKATKQNPVLEAFATGS